MLQEILDDDEGMAKQVVEAAKTSMGYDISEVDMTNVQTFADRVINLEEYRQRLREYLNSRMHSVAPNLSALIGEIVGARLISHAGSLTNLAKYPASTVQILGAEKALFRALKTKGNTPKYGLIFHSSFIGRASQKNKVSFSLACPPACLPSYIPAPPSPRHPPPLPHPLLPVSLRPPIPPLASPTHQAHMLVHDPKPQPRPPHMLVRNPRPA